ncbi:DUF2877 domain-containing protein [Mannheimia sp. AT1]|uniref:DUF2877 domain-containing protein n=1 Tax=Mannheimia cairinae TaxID=3025936 RepID=A0ABT5MQF4_9PAST|nr:DUF2877 domain-containing protein [Mannheimia cairinae]MDD0824285.1 DUF2877 domain-containing protein [Mannheimia cairinae]MDD0826592.1 DUF2877 domain-containing protein [Mannheimia cairinae]
MNFEFYLIDKILLPMYASLTLDESKIFSRHNHVINFISSTGYLFAVVDESVPLAPRQIRVKGNHLSFNINTLTLPNTPPPSFDCSLLIPRRDYLNKIVIEDGWKVLSNKQSEPRGEFQYLLYKSLKANIKSLFVELEKTRPDLNFPVSKLLGLGYGLTPTGDDFLSGLLISLSLAQSPYSHQRNYLVDAIYKSISQTNLISAAFISDACKQQISVPIQNFINALLGKDTNNNVISVVTSLGHSSGYDLLSGLLAGLPHPIERRKLLCPYIVD